MKKKFGKIWVEERGERFSVCVPSGGKVAVPRDQPLFSASGPMLQITVVGARLHLFSCGWNYMYEANYQYFFNRFLLTFHNLMGCVQFLLSIT